jgi:hypothetical protein
MLTYRSSLSLSLSLSLPLCALVVTRAARHGPQAPRLLSDTRPRLRARSHGPQAPRLLSARESRARNSLLETRAPVRRSLLPAPTPREQARPSADATSGWEVCEPQEGNRAGLDLSLATMGREGWDGPRVRHLGRQQGVAE